MKLYLLNADNIYFPQIKEYFKEIISSYDNGNYRSSMVMLYSTLVCDLLLKLKELSDIYSDTKAEKILNEINKKRRSANSSAWEWELINKIRRETELLTDESYSMIKHIYDLRNFSAHPALNDEYELISPTSEMTVAYIKKALEDVFVKPSVFAQNIVDRMSDDISARKEIYYKDFEAFKNFLNKVYFDRMSEKMVNQVFKAFWKFAFVKTDEDFYEANRYINRKTLEAILERYSDTVYKFMEENPGYFSLASDESCLKNMCYLLAYYPRIYKLLDQTIQYQIDNYNEGHISLIKWFKQGDLEQHIATYVARKDLIPFKLLDMLKHICEKQGVPHLFPKVLIKHYARSSSYTSAKNRFDEGVSHYLSLFSTSDFIELIDVINNNPQIYNYGWQKERNDKILKFARPLLPDEFDLSQYEHFKFTPPDSPSEEDTANEVVEEDVDIDDGLPF